VNMGNAPIKPVRTVRPSSFDEYMAQSDDLPEAKTEERRERDVRLRRFPYPVMLEAAYAELDCANRWCWLHFGPMDGECLQRDSEYRVCMDETTHHHCGTWTNCWISRTAYNFGFTEWYFAEEADRALFLANLPEINWGELYPSRE
jgi:hypothetical protein